MADEADRRDIRASLQGDGDAYARVIRRHQADVAAYMHRFSRQAGVCEELVQTVFVEAYLSLHRYRGEAPFAHWLRCIATRVGYRHWKDRDRGRARPTLTPADWERIAAPQDSALDPAEAGELLAKLLDQLPPRDRLVLTLMHLQGRSVAETAELTGWSRTMVKVQAHRARGRLRRLFEARVGVIGRR